MLEEVEKLEYMYQHFQDHEKVYESDPQITTDPIHDTLYPQMNNDSEYGLFENVVDSYYMTAGTVYPNPPCTHTYDQISQKLDSLADSEEQHTLYTNEADASLFTTDTAMQYAYNIIHSD